jgi:hypothetical protein
MHGANTKVTFAEALVASTHPNNAVTETEHLFLHE